MSPTLTMNLGRSCLIALTALLAIPCASARSGGMTSTAVAGNWSMKAVMLATPKSKSSMVWVGLRNNSQESALVCIRAFSFDVGDGVLREARNRVSPHACRADEAFTLVLGGETYFQAESIELPAIWDGTTKMRLNAGLRQLPIPIGGEPKETSVEWEGTLGDALHAGGVLAPPGRR
jgi:hypothetical protein